MVTYSLLKLCNVNYVRETLCAFVFDLLLFWENKESKEHVILTR